MNRYFTLAVLFCLAAWPAHAEINVGCVGPLTGPYAALGEQGNRGAVQAVADINAHGGINGEKLALIQADDACDPKQAVSVANQFARQGVRFVINASCSGAEIPASKIYNEENIFMMSSFATN